MMHNIVVKYLRRGIFFIANGYWKALGGLSIALLWLIAGGVFTCTLALFPLAIRCFKCAYISYKPFGRSVTVIYGKISFLGCVWILTFGAPLALYCILLACVSCAVLAGIPSLPQWSKLIKLALFPANAIIE